MKKHKTIYYFNHKFPQYGINSFTVEDELYLTGKTIDKVIQYLISYYVIDTETESVDTNWISVYEDYDNSKLLLHDTPLGSTIYLSYDREYLETLYSSCLYCKEEELKHELELVEERKNGIRTNSK